MTAQPDAIPPASSADDFDLILEAGRTEKHYWHDLWRYRELFIILALRDISVRYKQTVIGIAWALLQPFLTMVIMTVIFSKVAGLHSEGGAPYAIMVFAAMLPWMFFSSALSYASQSMVSNANLISKVYFPRLIIPSSTVVTALVDFFVSFLILIAMMIWYRFAPAWNILTLPIFIGISFLAALGPGLYITALNVKYRDFRYVIPFLVQFGLYVSPVGFSSTVIHEKLLLWANTTTRLPAACSSPVIREKLGEALFLLYSLNPMVGVIDGFRWAILGHNSPIYLPGFFLSLLVVGLFLILGVWYFRKTERSFADVI
ncbi:MAG: ABC transporter permease [Methylacidiphilales bacterium]|nr:ABC transporter permease [Candidatus Methylacidiphilales bacterium]